MSQYKMQDVTEAVEQTPVSEVDEQLRFLSNTADNLCYVVLQLEQCLSKVLRQENKTASSGGPQLPRPELVIVADKIRNNSDRVEDATNKISDIMHRLGV